MMDQLFNFINKHELDKHVVSSLVLLGTAKVTQWAMLFANAHPDQYLAIAAVTGPFAALQAASIKYYFGARTKDQNVSDSNGS